MTHYTVQRAIFNILYNGKESEKRIYIYIHIYAYIYIPESLCCIPETNTILLINCTSIF